MVNKSEIDSTHGQGATAAARAQSEAAHALPAHESETGSPGAPTSNTAPDNCIGGVSRILRAGIDSLYLSFSGGMHEGIESQLEALKNLAQSEDAEEQSKAVLELQGTTLQVLPYGVRNYPFILKNGMFNIQVSRDASGKLPLAYVQIASRALTEAGPGAVVDCLVPIIGCLGLVEGIKVSRVDLCCDFVTDFLIQSLPEESWVSRSRKETRRRENGELTGFVFGEGSPISARLYDKKLEIRKSRKQFLEDLWRLEGWDQQSQVWRLEYQIKRKPLTEFGLSSFKDVERQIRSLWAYATAEWLRLVVPGKDQTRSRWPTHPLWDVLQAADFYGGQVFPLTRSLSESVPDDRYLFHNGLAAITSYMAARGIPTFAEAGPAFLKEAATYHASRSLETGQDVEAYCEPRAKLKARKYFKKPLKRDEEEV